MDHRTTTMATLSVISLGALFGGAAIAQEKSLKEQIVGAWTLTSGYDDFGGKKVDTWGPNARGTVIFDKSGQFELLIISGDRPKSADPVGPALGPVGPALGYLGTYSIDEPSMTVTYHIVRSTYPGWDGTDQKRIFIVKGDEMTYKGAAPIPTSEGPFIPYMEWKRVK
jgi:Lipocalin-like domain